MRWAPLIWPSTRGEQSTWGTTPQCGAGETWQPNSKPEVVERSSCYGGIRVQQDWETPSCCPGFCWLACICHRPDRDSDRPETCAIVSCQGPAPSPLLRTHSNQYHIGGNSDAFWDANKTMSGFHARYDLWIEAPTSFAQISRFIHHETRDGPAASHRSAISTDMSMPNGLFALAENEASRPLV